MNASVKSVEDRGYVMTIGVDGMTTFLPFNEAVHAWSEKGRSSELLVGQVLNCRIVRIDGGRVVHLSANHVAVTNSMVSLPTSVSV